MAEDRRATILLIGANGQVGWELRQALAPLGAVVAHDRATLDLADLHAIRSAVELVAPTVIVNAAAYTHVDRAESEPLLAHRINAEAPAMLACAAADCDALLIHYSTDYVFDGMATRPYHEADLPNPLNAYGRSKRDGDIALLESDAAAYIFRVGWVYGWRGRNFLQTVRRLAATGAALRIVADQHGSPTWAGTIAGATAQAIAQLLRGRSMGATAPPGLYHLAAPDYTTWAGFAEAIVDAASEPGSRPAVTAIRTEDYPTPAQRPRWSVLDATLLGATLDVRLPPWRDQLADCLASQPSD